MSLMTALHPTLKKKHTCRNMREQINRSCQRFMAN